MENLGKPRIKTKESDKKQRKKGKTVLWWKTR